VEGSAEATMSQNDVGVPTNTVRVWIMVGTEAQLAMVIIGHWVAFIKHDGFATGGMLISTLAATLFARDARLPRGRSALWGAVVGGVCALVGILVSVALGDVSALILLVGTASCAVTGAIGGAIGGGER
jgi:hypothetical protein